MTTDETLAEILSMILERPVAPGENLRREDEAKWDSLKHLEIVFATEAAFGVSFSAEEIAELQDVAGLKAKADAA
ncbi:acyl carrier protein [Phenylobacterium sp. VNQ135]|uniref:acyl carrier protein n=1 Tax=Phenylobacterium sp. VNQ135 TaxID=3400922 RepID=UPI003C0E2356